MTGLASQATLDDGWLDGQQMRPLIAGRHQVAPRILGELAGQILERYGNAHTVRLLVPVRAAGQGTTWQDLGIVNNGNGSTAFPPFGNTPKCRW